MTLLLQKMCSCTGFLWENRVRAGQKTVHVHGFPRENPCMNTFFLKPGSWREIFIEKNRVQGTRPPCPFLLLGWAFGQCVCLPLSLSLSLSVCVCLSLFLSWCVSLISLSFLSSLSSLSLSLSSERERERGWMDGCAACCRCVTPSAQSPCFWGAACECFVVIEREREREREKGRDN